MRKKFDPEKLLGALEVTKKAAELGRWNQEEWISRWECGTQGCFAGTYALSQGCVPVFPDEEDPDGGLNDTSTTALIIDPDGNKVSVSAWAQDDLGLTTREAEDLFAGDNTLAGLEDLVGYIIRYREAREAHHA